MDSLLLLLLTLFVSIFLPNSELHQLLTALEPTPTPQVAVLGNATASADAAIVIRVIDGDTIELATGEKVRYIGIDTPETKAPGKPIECYGPEASQKNIELVEGKEVRLVKDVSDTDRYGRLLRYVYLPTESSESTGIFVNEILVKEGFAHASSYPPDIAQQDILRAAEAEARENNRGLWDKNVCQ